MAAKTDIELALAELEAGKFSFRMVGIIKEHVATLESDLAHATGVSESAGNMLRRQELTIARLEAELRKVNARVHALVKANALSESALREARRGVHAMRAFLTFAGRQTFALLRKAVAELSAVDYKALFDAAKSHPLTRKAQAGLANFDAQEEWRKLKALPLTEKLLRELALLREKATEYLPVAQKQFAAAAEKTTAFIANLNKNAA
jgi:hypothetical protein